MVMTGAPACTDQKGNGWAFAGIARILEYQPKNDPSREHCLAIFRRMAAALIERQGADGLWRMNLADPDEFPEPETSGSDFFCYGLAWGVNNGVLNRQKYSPAVERAWHGLTQNVSPEGEIYRGQPIGYEPRAITRDGTEKFVTEAFLLAGSEVYKLAPAK